MTSSLTDFHVHEHPLLAQRIVKIGFSWPAFLIGPAWLLFKKLWAPAAITLAVTTVLYLLNRAGDPLFADTLCSRSPLDPLSYYYRSDAIGFVVKGELTESCEDLRSLYQFLILFGINSVVALNGNELWARNLLNRGYVRTRTVKARSLDDVNAILARESAKFASTQPSSDTPQEREQTKELGSDSN